MESIKSTVMAICAVCAARSVIGGILSESKLKSGVIIMLDLFLALTMITPFAQGTIEFELPDLGDFSYTSADLEHDSYAAAVKEQTEENINSVLEQQFQSAGINYTSVETNVNISADYSISISSVTIMAEDYTAAALIVKSSLGMETEVINGNC
ncbi:MAG: hypothetical protein IKV85_07575 [Ruminococcus sp.]|nr:hypothetical protein [Ruminococcus sp.]